MCFPISGFSVHRLFVTGIALCAMSGSALWVRSDEPVSEGKKQEQKPPIAENRFGVHPPMLVLKELAVVSGKITKGPLTYTVERPGGHVVVPQQNVLFECEDLRDAYRILKKQIPDGSVKGHIVLARWCISHRLTDEARAELQITEGLDALNEEAMVLNAHLEEMLAPPPVTEPTRREADLKDPDVELKGFPAMYVEPLGGIPRHSGLEFTRKVQTILVNSCSNARCHGPESKRPFTLEIVRPQNRTRNLSEENLKRVLEFVEAGHPEKSALLHSHKDKTGKPTTPFETPQSKMAEKIVEDWILKLSEPDPKEDPGKYTGRVKQANAASYIVRGREKNRQRFLAQKQKDGQTDTDLARKQKIADQLLDDPDDRKREKSKDDVIPAPLAVDAD